MFADDLQNGGPYFWWFALHGSVLRIVLAQIFFGGRLGILAVTQATGLFSAIVVDEMWPAPTLGGAGLYFHYRY